LRAFFPKSLPSLEKIMHPATLAYAAAKECVQNLTELVRQEYLFCYSLTKSGALPKGARLVTSFIKINHRRSEPFVVVGDSLLSKIDKVLAKQFEKLNDRQRHYHSEVLQLTVAEFGNPDYSHFADIIRGCEWVELPNSQLLRDEVTRKTLKAFQARL
jgi:hypothetical protein